MSKNRHDNFKGEKMKQKQSLKTMLLDIANINIYHAGLAKERVTDQQRLTGSKMACKLNQLINDIVGKHGVWDKEITSVINKA